MFQLAALVVTATVAAPAARPVPASWGRSWQSVRRAAQKVKSVSAPFVQKKSMRILRTPLVSRGRLEYRAGGKIVWEYTSPLKSRLVLSGSRAVRYLWRNGRFTPDANRQASAMSVVLAEIKLWMQGRFSQSKVFSAKLIPGAPTRIRLTPRSKAMSRYVQRIELTLGKRPGTIAEVALFERAGAVTRIRFSGAKVTYR